MLEKLVYKSQLTWSGVKAVCLRVERNKKHHWILHSIKHIQMYVRTFSYGKYIVNISMKIWVYIIYKLNLASFG